MSEFVSITIEKDEAGPFLQVVTERAADLAVPNERVLESGLEDARTTIQSGGPDFGWPIPSPWTAKVDRAIGRTRQGALRETGALLGSLARGGPGNVFEASATEGQAGSSLPQAKLQQEGTDVGKTFFILQYLLSHGQRHEFGGRGIPPHPFLYWHEERFPEYDAIYLDHLTLGEAA